MAYHSKLEVAFLMDEFALPPPGPGENVLELLTPDGLKQPPGQSPGGTSNQSLGGASSQSPEGTSNQSPGGARNQLQGLEFLFHSIIKIYQYFARFVN